LSGSARGAGGTRERLLEVAEKEFARYGYAGAHLQSIAEQIGVQKTALYYYFPSKSALYTAVITTMLEAFERVLTGLANAGGTHRERLEHLLDALNDLLAERPNYARILIRVFIDGAGVDYPAIAPTIRRVIGGILGFYREGVEAGAFQRHSSRHLFLSVFGMALFHYAAPEFSGGVLELPDVFAEKAVRWRGEEVRRLLLEGVLPRPPETDR
jgi:TetR/AcrR family transcriptional regulator